MNKKLMVSLVAIVLSLCFLGTGLALDKGNKRKGKYTYRKVYKACYERGEVESPKPTLNPDAKTQAQWERIFDKKEFKEFGCKTEWDKLDKDNLKDIFAYLYEHAADSPTPAKCK